MKVLIDTNVFLDIFLNREPHAEHSARMVSLAARGAISGLISAVSVATIYYHIEKNKCRKEADNALKKLLKIVKVAPVTEAQINGALCSDYADFEDAVIYHSAETAGAACIVTRDKKGFKGLGGLPVCSPDEFMEGIG